MQKTVDELETRFGLLSHREQRADFGEVCIEPGQVVTVLEWLKRHGGYVHLTHFTVVDWLEENEFQLSYLLTDPYERHTLMVTTRIDRAAATMESIHTLWPEAVTYEQEHHEMYGISFPGSPRQGHDFMLEGWTGPPPMLRDFDTLAYCEESYDFRPGRHSLDPKEVRARFKAEQDRLKAEAAQKETAPQEAANGNAAEADKADTDAAE